MKDFKSGLILGFVIAFLQSSLITTIIHLGNKERHSEIIKEECGYYDPATREFKFGRLK